MKMPLCRAVLLAAACSSVTAGAADAWHFDFNAGKPVSGRTPVAADAAYSGARGFGFEAGAGQASFFSVDLPEGNYKVSVTLDASTTVKAELRRLMLEKLQAAPGAVVTREFTVNIRTPRIAATGGLAAGEVKLKAPRETVQEAWAWDHRLTLEFNGVHPDLRALDIVPVKTPTVFLIGDSTVCDQPSEPYSSWGQMLPRFLKPGIAVANHGESGETYRDSIARRRLDKILSVLRPGDTVLMQFGHNDQKQIRDGKGGPFTTYKAELKVHAEAVRARGGIPVVLSPMERRNFDAAGKVVASLADYAEAARQAAEELHAPFIDLNALSKPFYEALGRDKSRLAFAEPKPGQVDNTHHNNYGSYELAKMVAAGLRKAGLAAGAFVTDDALGFDPAHPDPVEGFGVPASPKAAAERPLGDEAVAYLFAYFTGNGEDGLHLAASGDGYRWDKLNGGRSYLTPSAGTAHLMRDPCIVRGPDGTFHMVWTSGWNESGIGYASSKDLVHWSAQKTIPVMAHEAGTLNAWAPEIVYDDARAEFLIFWASTVTGKFPQTAGQSEEKYNHRIYATTTKDFNTFTPATLFYEPGFSVIDATFLRANGKPYLLVKDETRNPPRKYLQLAAATTLQGPFDKLGAPITPPGLWAEGPTALQVGADVIVYYDAYTAKHYGALRSRDLVTWEDVTAQMHFPDEGTAQRMRHGTAIAVPAALVDALRAAPVPASAR